MTKYVAEEGSDCQLTGMISIANPWDFHKGVAYAEKGSLWNWYIYRFVLGGALQRLYELHKDIFFKAKNPPLDLEVLKHTLLRHKITLRQFDNSVTAPLYGFKDAMDIYYHASSAKVLHNIRIPVLGINSLDDPIVGRDYLPYDEAFRNPWLILAVTNGGGHMGWFEQSPDGSLTRWYVKPVKEFVKALMECDLPPRPVPRTIVDADGRVEVAARPEISFKERLKESIDIVTSGDGESKLFSGW